MKVFFAAAEKGMAGLGMVSLFLRLPRNRQIEKESQAGSRRLTSQDSYCNMRG